MILLYLLGFLAWAVPTVAAVWYLMAFRDIHREVRLIRRYLQDLHERTAGRPEQAGSRTR